MGCRAARTGGNSAVNRLCRDKPGAGHDDLALSIAGHFMADRRILALGDADKHRRLRLRRQDQVLGFAGRLHQVPRLCSHKRPWLHDGLQADVVKIRLTLTAQFDDHGQEISHPAAQINRIADLLPGVRQRHPFFLPIKLVGGLAFRRGDIANAAQVQRAGSSRPQTENIYFPGRLRLSAAQQQPTKDGAAARR